MSLLGVTKGTDLEKQVGDCYENEIRAIGLYHGLILLAKEQGHQEYGGDIA
jgi:hypothetical protein